MPTTLERRMDNVESRVFDQVHINKAGDPTAAFLPEALTVESVTPGPDGAFVVLSWGNWQSNVEAYEVWMTRPDGSQELMKEVQYSPAAFTISVDSAQAMEFTVRAKAGDKTVALERSPTTAALIPPPEVGALDIADGAVGDSHFDRVSANSISIVNADILDLAANKINAGTLEAGVILSSSIAATQIEAGTLLAGVILASSINANQINAGTMSAVNVEAGTFLLISGNNTMEINGTDGFIQTNTALQSLVKLADGQIRVESTSGSGIVSSITAGIINLFDDTVNDGIQLIGNKTVTRIDLLVDGDEKIQLDGLNNRIDLKDDAGTPVRTIRLDGALGTITLGSSAAVRGILTLHDPDTAGSASIKGDDLTGGIGFEIGGPAYPDSHQTDDLGLATRRWNTIYGDDVDVSSEVKKGSDFGLWHGSADKILVVGTAQLSSGTVSVNPTGMGNVDVVTVSVNSGSAPAETLAVSWSGTSFTVTSDDGASTSFITYFAIGTRG